MATDDLAPAAGAVNPATTGTRSTTAHEDQYAPEPVSGDDFRHSSRFGCRCGHPACELYGRCMTGDCQRAQIDRIRRVTLAHLHMREGEG